MDKDDIADIIRRVERLSADSQKAFLAYVESLPKTP